MQRRLLPLAVFALYSCRAPARNLSVAEVLAGKPVELAHDQVLTGVLPAGKVNIAVRLNLSEPQMVRAELAAAEGSDMRISIFQKSESPLVVVDDQPENGAEELPPVWLAAGEARIEISAETSSPAPLKFFYRLFRAPADVEREPNQTLAAASPMPAFHASGFYGPLRNLVDKDATPERDCFVHALEPEQSGFMDVKLTPVDGIQPSLLVYGARTAAALAAKTGIAGKSLHIAAVKIAGLEKVYLCVSGTRVSEAVSRDYYDLVIAFTSTQNRSEVEPNDSAKTATEVAQGIATGTLASPKDLDYFSYLNQREYPVLVRIALAGKDAPQMRIALQQREGLLRNFEYSAPQSEVIENARLEAGENLVFAVQTASAVKKRAKAPVAYELKISESPFSDENEAEPNGQEATADSLVDATYKWGFINPPGDVDFYRLQLTETVRRQLRVESKLACKLSLEHSRAGKPVKVTRSKAPLVYEADFASGDTVRLACVDVVLQPADRAYRIALSEP